MDYRELGQSGIKIAPLVLGGNVFGWTVKEKMRFDLLDAFTDAGFNCIDTADIYSTWVPGNHGGESETMIGQWLKSSGKRKDIVIATKVGMEMGLHKKGLSRKYILNAIEDSLKRLQTDYIDLYQSHEDDQSTPQDETLEAYTTLIQQGKVRAIGASNFNGERLKTALQISKKDQLAPYQSLQPLYNLCERVDYETNLEPVCQKYKLGVLPYYSLASGFLTGKYRSEADLSKSPRGQQARKYMNERGFRILDALDKVAGALQVDQAQVALAWLIARPSVTAPIVSATNLEQLNDLMKAAQLKLDEAAVTMLDEASA